jgi:hypothetical protein
MSCSPKLQIGTYTTSADDKILFAGTDVDVFKNDKIAIHHWTDTGSRYGEGRYVIKGKKIEIEFDKPNAVRANFLEEDIKSIYADAYSYKIVTEKDSGLFGANISAMDKDDVYIEGGIIQEKGIGIVNIPTNIKVHYLLVSAFGHANLKIPISSDGSKQFTIQLRNTFVEYFEEGQIKTYKMKTKKDLLILNDGKHEYNLRYKSK